MRDLGRQKFPKYMRQVESHHVRLNDDKKLERFHLAVMLLENPTPEDCDKMKAIYAPHMDDFTDIEIKFEAHLILLRQNNCYAEKTFVHVNLTVEEMYQLNYFLHAKGPVRVEGITAKYLKEFEKAKMLHGLPMEEFCKHLWGKDCFEEI